MLILLYIIIILLFFLTCKERYKELRMTSKQDIMARTIATALREPIEQSIAMFKSKLYIIYCSGCKDTSNTFLIKLWKGLDDSINQTELTKIDLSRINNPLDIIKGIIHPKYIIKTSVFELEEEEEEEEEESVDEEQYIGRSKILKYFKNREDVVKSSNKTHVCKGPKYITTEDSKEKITTLQYIDESKNFLPCITESTPGVFIDNCKYEDTDEYNNNECDYYLVYKTPTIIYELKENIYIKLDIAMPNLSYPCNEDDSKKYELAISNFILKITAWIKYINIFYYDFDILYDMIKIDVYSSCTTKQLDLITNRVLKRDMFSNIVQKYYKILTKCYPDTEDELKAYKIIQEHATYSQATNFLEIEYKDNDYNSTFESKSDFLSNLDLLRITNKYNPYNSNLLINENNYSIRGVQRILDYSNRTIIVQVMRELNEPIDFIENAKNCGCNYVAILGLKYLFLQDQAKITEITSIKEATKISKYEEYPYKYSGEMNTGIKSLLKELVEEGGFPNKEDIQNYFSQPESSPVHYLITLKKDIDKDKIESFPIWMGFNNGAVRTDQGFGLKINLYNKETGFKGIDSNTSQQYIENHQRIIQIKKKKILKKLIVLFMKTN